MDLLYLVSAKRPLDGIGSRVIKSAEVDADKPELPLL
jgi:hypothetical protein